MTTWRFVAFSILAAFYFVIPNARPDFTRYNCHDSENYLALSWNLVGGRGYTRSMSPDIYVPHTTWPPGVSILMVPAVCASDRTLNWHAVKWTMSAIGLAGIVCTWLYMRRLSGSDRLADLAAATVGTNTIYWDFSHQAMAELPLAVWLIFGLYLIDRNWANRNPKWYGSLAVGIACGFAMMFKGHAGALVFAPLAYWVGPRRAAGTTRSLLANWLIFAAGFAIPQAAWMARNAGVEATGFDGLGRFRSILAVDPNEYNGPLVTQSQLIARVKENIFNYGIYRFPEQIVPGLWGEGAFAWKGSGILAVLLTVGLVVMSKPWRPSTWPIWLVIVPIVGLNILYGFGGNPRFWIPATVPLSVAIIASINPERLRSTTARAAIAMYLVVIGANLALYVYRHELDPYPGKWKSLAALFERIRQLDDGRADRVLAPNEAAFSLMTGRPSHWGDGKVKFDRAIIYSDNPDFNRPGVIFREGPWLFLTLPASMTVDEIKGYTK